MTNNRHLLIINHGFPPFGGVGGRRWAKFTKYFSEFGVGFTVLTFNGVKEKSNWTNDIETFKDNIVTIDSKYPKIITEIPTNFFKKIQYRIALVILKMTTKGNYFDKSSSDKKILQSNIEQLIESKNVTDVIVSVAPFKLAYFVSELIPKYPNINFIVDFRDPWVNNKTSYGFNHLAKRKQMEEIGMEKQVVSRFHHVVSVAPQMTNYFKNLIPGNKNQFHTIINGFDPNEFGESTKTNNKSNSKLSLVFTGTFYNNTDYLMSEFEIALDEIRTEFPNIFERLLFQFYGADSQRIARLSEEFDCIENHGFVQKNQVKSILEEAEGALLFLSKDITYSFSTKFCEYIAMEKPVIVFSNPGATIDFVQKNKIGYGIMPGGIKKGIIELYKKWEANQALFFNPDFDKGGFNIADLSKTYLKLAQS